MKIVFSTPLKLSLDAQLIETHTVAKIHTHLYDSLVKSKHKVTLIAPETLPNIYSTHGWVSPLGSRTRSSTEFALLYDSVASFHEALTDCDVFIGTGCTSLHQMLKVKQHGGKVATTWFNCHWSYAQRVLENEYSTFNVKPAQPIMDPLLVWRCEQEQPLSDRIVVPSDVCGDTYRAFPKLRDKVRTVGLGVDAERFHPGNKPAGFRVLYAGGNWIRKGLPYLTAAWNHLHYEDGNLTLMGAEPPPFDRDKQWHTEVTGWISDEDAVRTYQNNKVFVFPSLEEGAASVVFEAMASGLAVITTKMGSADMINDRVEGLIVEPRDANQIASALRFLHDTPAAVDQLGAQARQKIQQYPWSRFGDNVIKVLEEMAE